MFSSPREARRGARRSRTILGTLIAVGATTLASREAHASPSHLYPCSGTEYDLRAIMETGEVPSVNFDAPGHDLDDGSVTISHGAFASVFPDGIPFFGLRTDIFANTNGNITFGEPMYAYTPDAIPGLTQPTIAPFFGDVDFNGLLGGGVPNGAWTMCVEPEDKRVLFTWREVGYFAGHTDKQNSFQIALIDNDETCSTTRNFALELRYDGIEWTTGDASGGVGGLGGIPAVVGIDAGDGATAVALAGSGTEDVLDLASASNVGEPGVFRFLITEDGLPSCGDGVVDACEACDDGNDVDDDACTNTCQVPSCTNPLGCEPPKEDPCADGGGCSPHATCSVDEGDVVPSAICTCIAGYEGDGVTCDDVDECDKGGPCSPRATCTNTVGSFACSCEPGFTGDGFTCVDVDECASDATCGDHSSCLNQPGGFFCTCDAGFRPTVDGCVDVDECAEGNADCSPHATCTNAVGTYACACDEGWEGDGSSCANIDECAQGDPCGGAKCVDDPGGYHCNPAQGGTGGESGTGGGGESAGEGGAGDAAGSGGSGTGGAGIGGEDGAGGSDPHEGSGHPGAVRGGRPYDAAEREGGHGEGLASGGVPVGPGHLGGHVPSGAAGADDEDDGPIADVDGPDASGAGLCAAADDGRNVPSGLATLLAIAGVMVSRRRKR